MQKRSFAALVLPVVILTLGLTVFALSALRQAASEADLVSARRQEREIRLAVDMALDELAQSQAGVAIWDSLLLQVRARQPDWTWVDDNVASLLNTVFVHDIDAILDASDRPMYLMRDGKRVPAGDYALYAAAAEPLVAATRGRDRRPANPHERLPGQAARPDTTARTAAVATHATDLGIVGGRLAAMSVMRIIPSSEGVPRTPGREPLLVSIRYLDTGFTRNLAKFQLVAGARIVGPDGHEAGERAIPLLAGDGRPVAQLAWRPDRPGRAVWQHMAPSAGAALVALLATLLVLILIVARLMRKDARTLSDLASAHLELQAKEAQAHHLAYHDVLTGLPNRALFNSVVDQQLADADPVQEWAVLLVDLDRFKNVNDTLGHLAGDQLIQQVSARIQDILDQGDLVARLGGDEFAIFLDNRPDVAEFGAIAERIVASIRQPFTILGTDVYIGASVGVATYPSCSNDRAELMRMADIAMYRAKAEGRDGYRLFSEEMDESVKLRRGLEHDLRSAILRGQELSVHYQPQMDATGGRVIGLEALLRWTHPERGRLSPDAFIPIAEETGLICDLGRFVLRDACTVARQWPDLSIAVNLSPAQFRTHDLAAEIIGIVREAGANPAQLEFEVTESTLLANDDSVRGALAELRKAGFRVALDDFGTGYSSLSYLSRFEVDKIKIDRSFISRLGEADDAAAIIHAVVRLGHAMGLSVSAEGVETREQRAFLESAGCNELQGFLFSAGVPAPSLMEFIRRRQRAA